MLGFIGFFIMVTSVLSLKFLSKETYVLFLERRGVDFVPGQYMVLKDPVTGESREYSIYSGTNEDHLAFLIRIIPDGVVSVNLSNLTTGDILEMDGPWGFFVLDQKAMNSRVFLLATGTGVSPFRSFVLSFPALNYQLFHGIKYSSEAYDREQYPIERHHLCPSREVLNGFQGYVTTRIRDWEVNPEDVFYLCGNARMIDRATDHLESRGVLPKNIRSEVFF